MHKEVWRVTNALMNAGDIAEYFLNEIAIPIPLMP